MKPAGTTHRSELEVWGGVECSVVRLESHVCDQLALTGHDRRVADLELFAALGLRTLRYPVLWDRHVEGRLDWSWADERLHRLRELGIRPIVGLLHHGGGPLPGGFLDPGFVNGLARFARAVAERYPWIDAYTPINEPLTTARFSALYGLWHPFRRDVKTFARVLLDQYHAIRAAMRAVREVNPHAELVQTEDIGKTHSTERLAYQADWENERRWLTFDILNGQLTPQHALWSYLRWAGIEERELESFRDEPCPPDILGMNHYVTSERLLDDQLENYPPDVHGGNHRDAYADVPAVRAMAEGASGPAQILHEMWERFRRPMAITEVQLACTREEQLRWLHEMWAAAQKARREGADVRAVTAWALLGAFDWDSLLLQPRKHYENGAFDLRSGEPRPTALAHALKSLAESGRFTHPAADGPGWWRRPARLVFPPVSAPRTGDGTAVRGHWPSGRPLLIVGAGGAEGDVFARIGDLRALPLLFVPSAELDLADPAAIQHTLSRYHPWAALVQLNASDLEPGLGRDDPHVRRFGALCAGRGIAVALFESVPAAAETKRVAREPETAISAATALEPAPVALDDAAFQASLWQRANDAIDRLIDQPPCRA